MLEFEGKQLLEGAGIPIPRGGVAASAADARHRAATLGGAVVVKAQVHSGGRGKAGLVQYAAGPDETEAKATALLGREWNGERVKMVLIEERLAVARELYLAITVDETQGLPALLFSTRGGVEVEDLARESPETVHRLLLPVLSPLRKHSLVDLLRRTDLPAAHLSATAETATRLYRVARERDAVLAEINPLVVTSEGALVAVDAKVVLDEAALFRQSVELDPSGEAAGDDRLAFEQRARSEGMSFVHLGGEIGVVAGGAGLAMMTVDMIAHYGGKAANFLDTMGATEEKMAKALRLVLSVPGVRGVITNNAAGLSSCSELAAGILEVIREDRPRVPIVVKLRGKGEKESWRLLEGHGVRVIGNGTTEEAVREILRLAS